MATKIIATINQVLGCIVIYSEFDHKKIEIGEEEKIIPVSRVEIQRNTEEIKNPELIESENNSKYAYTYDYGAEPGFNYMYKAIGYYDDEDLPANEREKEISFSLQYILNDMFLFDKDNNFRIQYDPDVTSFKIITDDAITKTLGSRYPFARRNGDAYYKQFTIGGLISAADANVTEDQHRTGEPKPLGLSLSSTSVNNYDDMIINERKYREKVLDFLHDGKIKIFKSNTEGIIPVRLTNISLTPNKTLGRNIWSFTVQATEMAMPNYTLVF